MTIQTIAILGTGDMGSAVAACVIEKGMRVVTCLAGRSGRSKDLARDAGMKNCNSLEAMIGEADMLLSIVPPAVAVDFANEVCPLIKASERDVLFVDCNAIAPTTAWKIAVIANQHKVNFQDVGIIGAAPRPERAPVRFYTSGPWNDVMQELATDLIDVRPLGEDIAKASSIKMVYASLTKGTHALRAAALLAGEQLGVSEEIRAEWQGSWPETYSAMEKRMPILASDSGRWTGEMREIAKTYESVGLPSAFHEGAEWMYEFLAETSLAGESRDEARKKDRSIEEIVALLHEALLSRR